MQVHRGRGFEIFDGVEFGACSKGEGVAKITFVGDPRILKNIAISSNMIGLILGQAMPLILHKFLLILSAYNRFFRISNPCR